MELYLVVLGLIVSERYNRLVTKTVKELLQDTEKAPISLNSLLTRGAWHNKSATVAACALDAHTRVIKMICP